MQNENYYSLVYCHNTPQVYLSGKVSSQYLTALLMAAPLAVPGGAGGDALEIIIKDELVSQPYVDMTVKLMERFGVKVERLDGLQHLRVGGWRGWEVEC